MNFMPSVYEHAAALIGRSPWDVSRSADLLFDAHASAFRRYGHAPVVVGVDLYNLEAEAYGAGVGRPDGHGIPAISKHPCRNAAAIRGLNRFNPQKDGRLPLVLEAGQRLARAFPDADIRVPVSGPFSLASNLVGFEQWLCDVFDDPVSVRESLLHLVEGQAAFCREIAARGLGIALFESAATPPLLSPELFVNMELPALNAVVREASLCAGHPAPCVIGGNTAPILDALLTTGTRYVVCPFETDQALFMRKMRAHPGVMVRINTALTGFAAGDWASVKDELDRVLRLAAGRQQVCIGTGALPFETDPEMVIRAGAYVQEQANILT